MRSVVCRLFAIFVPSLLTVETASAAGAYVGGGVSKVSLSSSNSTIDGRAANGLTIFGGYEFASTWSAELAFSVAPKIDTGPTENIYYPADSAQYSILRAGMRKNFWNLAEHHWAPWIGAGTAYHYIYRDTYYYYMHGTGFFVAGGVDVQLDRSWHFRAQAVQHRFSVRDNYDYGPFRTRALELSGAVIYYFRR